MQLIMIECVMCNYCFSTKVSTGYHKCPKCNTPNMRYVFDDNITDEETELVSKIHNEIKDIFYSYGMDDVSDIKILDLILGK